MSGVGILFLAEVIDGRLFLEWEVEPPITELVGFRVSQKTRKRKTLTNVLLFMLPLF